MKRTDADKKSDQAYLNELLQDQRILNMSQYVHHKHSDRLSHVVGVVQLSLRKAYRRGLNCDYKSLIRGALLHDYYPYDQNDISQRPKWHWIKHALYAYEQANKDFELTNIEKDIIRNHMWPLTLFHMPHTKEAWIVSSADSMVAIRDFFKRKKK